MLIGRHEWRIDVVIDDDVSLVPMFRRVGFDIWQYPAAFAGPVPTGVLNYALQPGNVLLLADAVKDAIKRAIKREKVADLIRDYDNYVKAGTGK
jgi:hypothetical protein